MEAALDLNGRAPQFSGFACDDTRRRAQKEQDTLIN